MLPEGNKRMKYIILSIVVVLGLGGIFLISQKDTGKPETSKPSLTIAKVQTDTANGGQLIDVRTAEEFAAGHIDGAINLSLQDIEKNIMPNVAKDKTVYLYCRSGNRSGQATVILKKAGYQNIVDLGAMTSVQAIGGTIKS